MKKALIVVVQLFFLWLLNELGYFLVNTFNLPIPGNVLGMVLLFILLLTGVVSLKWVEEASSLLIKHLAFFFIPIAVGLMSFGSLFIQHGITLASIVIGSAAIGIYVTGMISQTLAKKKEGGNVEHERHPI
ncbi:murein hydrolase regulator LrgA [Anaerobacillus alkalidiazotrophicus]|uniref:Murein hydrolase regulator LrgA n=1 Tax=Anaerobacillus alkalidiazotrophicus TaxID=472963 RepID=A0A1S2M9M7_9BACI|nr:CidA/LrgA family protein [Anaerobacillus alkalidiazotrophicus]OIJ21324.1 murein hydrolase regulator LrgA [Anaerobacillus alkalidiazotrophicus]